MAWRSGKSYYEEVVEEALIFLSADLPVCSDYRYNRSAYFTRTLRGLATAPMVNKGKEFQCREASCSLIVILKPCFVSIPATMIIGPILKFQGGPAFGAEKIVQWEERIAHRAQRHPICWFLPR